MNMKALSNIDRVQISKEVMLLLLSLYESKGKSFYYDDLFSRDQNAFERKTMAVNIVAIANYLNLNMTDARIRLLSKKNMAPRTKDEHGLSNIKTALNQLHRNPESFELLVNEVSNLAKGLSREYEPITYQTYERQDEGVFRARNVSKNEQLDQLLKLLSRSINQNTHELTQLIVNFYVDFMNMEIFTVHNDLIGMIILYALLLKHFNVFKYVSFFKYFSQIKDAWQSGLITANYYWSNGFAQTDMLDRLLVDLLIKAYEEVDQLAHEYEFEKKLNKSDNIENSVLKLGEVFAKEDLRKRHPNVSDATIDRTLKRLKDENKIRPIGRGRGAKWQRIIKGHKKLSMEQLSLFND